MVAVYDLATSLLLAEIMMGFDPYSGFLGTCRLKMIEHIAYIRYSGDWAYLNPRLMGAVQLSLIAGMHVNHLYYDWSY